MRGGGFRPPVHPSGSVHGMRQEKYSWHKSFGFLKKKVSMYVYFSNQFHILFLCSNSQ